MIDRREAVAGLAAMFGAQLFAPIARAAAASGGGPVAQVAATPPAAPMFTAAQRALVAALSERVLPATDTPGAIAAGVPAYIETLLADWSYPQERVPILRGLEAIDAHASKRFQTPAAETRPEQQDGLLTMAMRDELPGGAAFFEPFRQMVVVGYYTSEIGITQEREYLPVPGRYDGRYPYSEVKKVFSA